MANKAAATITHPRPSEQRYNTTSKTKFRLKLGGRSAAEGVIEILAMTDL
jgi:hypothetical protein